MKMASVSITEAVLDAAFRKAVEAGVFPRRCTECDRAIDRDIMRAILGAAFDAAAMEECHGSAMPAHHAQPDAARRQRGLH